MYKSKVLSLIAILFTFALGNVAQAAAPDMAAQAGKELQKELEAARAAKATPPTATAVAPPGGSATATSSPAPATAPSTKKANGLACTAPAECASGLCEAPKKDAPKVCKAKASGGSGGGSRKAAGPKIQINWDLWKSGRCQMAGIAFPANLNPDVPLRSSEIPPEGICSKQGPEYLAAFANPPNGFDAVYYAAVVREHGIKSVQELQGALNCTREWFAIGKPEKGPVRYAAVVVGGVFEEATPGMTVGPGGSRKIGPAGGGVWCVTEDLILGSDKLSLLLKLAKELQKTMVDMAEIRKLFEKLPLLATKVDINDGVRPLREILKQILKNWDLRDEVINALIASKSRYGLGLTVGGHPGASRLGFAGLHLVALVPFGQSTSWALDFTGGALIGYDSTGQISGGATVDLMVTKRFANWRMAFGGLGSWLQTYKGGQGYTPSLLVGGGLKGCRNFGVVAEWCVAGGPGMDLVGRNRQYTPTFGGVVRTTLTFFLDRPIKPVRRMEITPANRQALESDPFPQIDPDKVSAVEPEEPFGTGEALN